MRSRPSFSDPRYSIQTHVNSQIDYLVNSFSRNEQISHLDKDSLSSFVLFIKDSHTKEILIEGLWIHTPLKLLIVIQ